MGSISVDDLNSPLGDYLTVEQVAVMADRSIATIWRWVHAGLLPRPERLLGRVVFRANTVTTAIAAQRESAASPKKRVI